jgi:taurine dioxygenase
VEVTRIGGYLGAEIRGVDLCTPSAHDIRALERALGDHQVVVVRDQALHDDAHRDLAAALGEPWVGVAHGSGQPVVGYIVNDDAHLPAADLWHADSTFEANPPACGILRAEVVPAYGGDTVWTSMAAVHDELSPALRGALEQLHAEHAMPEEYIAAARSTNAHEVTDVARTASVHAHPLICRTAFSERRTVFYNPRYVTRVLGVGDAESHAICSLLDTLLADPRFHFRWRWSVGDVALWDERAVVHRGLSDHFASEPQHRLMVTARSVRPDAVPTSPAHVAGSPQA